MKNKNTRRGFTLIELLVVVLIIGILAAVAVPQYQKAVYKSRATEAVTMLKSINQAQEVYYLANGEYTDDLTMLDIDIPSEQITSSTQGNENEPLKYYYRCWEKRTCGAFVANSNMPDFEFVMLHESAPIYNGKFWCKAKGTTESEMAMSKSICQSMGTLSTALNVDWFRGKFYQIN